MKIVKKLSSAALIKKYHSNRDFDPYLERFFTKYGEYDLASLNVSDFKKLLLNSSPNNPFPKSHQELPLMGEVIEQINQDLSFFETSHPDRGLSGTTVKDYLKQFESGQFELEECFVQDKDEGMRPAGNFYIADGMHRLVAYGLYSGLSPKFFPIQVILGQGRKG